MMKLSASSISSSSRLPEMYHIATFSPARIVLPFSSASRRKSGPGTHMHDRRLVAVMISGTIFGTQVGIGPQFRVFRGEFVQRQQAAADRITCRVVAADDQQQQVLPGMNSAGREGRIARRSSPCASIEIRSGAGGNRCRVFHTSLKYSSICRRITSRFCSESISVPARVFTVATFDQYVRVRLYAPRTESRKQRRQHLRGQFDRHPVHPVPEHLAARQFIEDPARAFGGSSSPSSSGSEARRSATRSSAARRAWAGPWR